ncbi:YitT family protein [Lagierella sp.]|uniref:YitT family protein n=1 Tax=Lagierella sp. TaxID=2849657 RepID=UPI002611C098|nr:YitT family protein [Lagierella sp.]
MKFIQKNDLEHFVKNFILMSFGTLLFAISVNMFYVPYNLVSGGVTGIAVILKHFFGFTAESTIFWTTFPLLALSLLLLGKKYTVNTIYCSFLLPALVKVTKVLPIFTGDKLFAAILGGIMAGLGLGFVFRAGSSTGGTAILEQSLTNYTKLPLNISVLLIDGSIIVAGFFTFDFKTGIYSIISLLFMQGFVGLTQKSLKEEYKKKHEEEESKEDFMSQTKLTEKI